jgi:hypothetical protein
MTERDGAWFDLLRRSHWLTHAPTQLVRCAPAGDGRWSLGSITVSEADLLAARPTGPVDRIRLFHLVHEGWRVASFTLFRPLVYFAAFSAPEIFECLRLAVASLIERGGWQWDVLVLTAADTADKVRSILAPCGLGERLHVACVAPARDPLDWCMARYRLDAHPVMPTPRAPTVGANSPAWTSRSPTMCCASSAGSKSACCRRC